MKPHAYGSPVAGYVRSPRLNDPELDVLEAQIRKYALEYGYNLAKVFREEGISSMAAGAGKACPGAGAAGVGRSYRAR
jgi:hypothetical protein